MPVGQLEAAGNTPCGTGLDHLREGAAQGSGHFRRQDAFAFVRVADQLRLVRGIGGEVQGVDAQGRQAHAVVLDDPHQLGQCGGAVAGAADGGGQRRHQVIEGVADLFPAAMNVQERLDFHHGAYTAVARALVPALE
ncbi:hypothetical protein D3C86_1416840 [compost metagenome]